MSTTLESGRVSVLAALQQAQEKHGCVSEAVIVEVARSIGLPVGEVYGVATFYSFLSVRPRGRNVVRICKSLPCHMNNGAGIIQAIRDELGILPGQTTADGMFTLEVTNCIGACDMSPAMLVNGDLHGNLTPDRAASVLKAYR